MATFDIRFSMQAEAVHDRVFFQAYLDALDSFHISNDMSEVDEEGHFSVWIEVDADQPAAALTQGFDALARAQSIAAAKGYLDEPRLRSAELLVAS